MEKETKVSDKVSFTAESVVDELIGAGTAAVGIVGGSYAMQTLKTKAKLNDWLVSGGGFGLGFAGRLAANLIKSKQWREIVKDLSTGIMAAGALDAAKKMVDILFPTAAEGSAIAQIKKAIPTLSGEGGNDLRWGNYGVPTTNKLGAFNSNLLNGDGVMKVPMNSTLLN